ncbi:HPr family phosphocarrier protein [bacterium]|nr:HPr family phosphocarrier protein [bacterium]
MEAEEIKLTILNKAGLHTRAAAQIVEKAKQFNADITIEKDGTTADAKSIMGILILAAQKDSEILIRACGKDAKDAIFAIRELVQNRFGEDN